MSEEASPLCKGLEVFILPSLGLASGSRLVRLFSESLA